MIKYGTKIFTEPDTQKKSGKRSTPKIYALALDNIYAAMKGRRIFERFGFNLPKNIKKDRVDSRLLNDFQQWAYHPKSMDWLHKEHESTLTTYTPPQQLVELLKYQIDTSLG